MASANQPSDAIDAIPEDYIGDPEKFKQSMWRVTGFYSQFKQKLRSARAAVNALATTPSTFNIDYAKDKFAETERQYDRLCTSLAVADLIAGGEKDGEAKVVAKQEVAKGEFELLQTTFLMNMAKATPKKMTGAQATGAIPKIVKQFNEALKPFTLELDHLPHEYRKWKKTMASYFRNNMIEAEDPVVQNEYVSACISADLDSLITAEVEDAAPAYDSDVGILALIEKVYEVRHTMTSKRLALFMCKSKQGEAPVAFIARLNQLYQDADLAAMTVDEMRTFFLISGITNSTLRTKLIEMKDPKYEEVCEKVNAWAATSATSKAIEKSQNNEGKVKAVKGKSDKGKGKKTLPPPNIKIHPTALEGRCFCCGSGSHDKRSCERVANAKCTNCNATGHYKNVCLAEYIAWRNKTFNIQAKGKPNKGKAKKIDAEDEIMSAPETDDEDESSQE